MSSNAEFRLTKKPSQDYPKNNEQIFQLKNIDTISKDKIPSEHVLVKTKFMSVDAAMRVWISGLKSYREPILPGDAMEGASVGEVIATGKNCNLKVGQLVVGVWNWSKVAVVKQKTLSPIPNGIPDPENFLGVYGISGLTAYIGLFKIGKPKKGETVLVSAAAGAVGEIVVQLAKNFGC